MSFEHPRFMIIVSLRTIILAAVIGTGSVRGQTTLNGARSTLDKWVETRQIISKTKSEWQSDKDLLEQSIQLFERELKSVEEQISKVGTNSTQVEKERAQTEVLLKSSNETL